MKALQLDYRAKRRPRLAAYVLAAFAIAFAAEAAFTYRSLGNAVAAREARLAKRAAAPRPQAPIVRVASLSPEDHVHARDTARRLSMPWADLFQALEAAHSDRVALLAIEPEPETRAVSISGEARDYLAALTYVAQLANQRTLERVHLLKHENRPGSRRPLAFTVSATWREQQ